MHNDMTTRVVCLLWNIDFCCLLTGDHCYLMIECDETESVNGGRKTGRV